MINFLFGKSNQTSLTGKDESMVAIDDEYDFPGDRQCDTLRRILVKVQNLRGISATDRQVAIEGIKTALRVLCPDE